MSVSWKVRESPSLENGIDFAQRCNNGCLPGAPKISRSLLANLSTSSAVPTVTPVTG